MHRSHRRRALQAGAVATLAAAGSLAGVSTATAQSAFYNTPDVEQLPSQNGALVKTQKMKLGAAVKLPPLTTTQLPGTATRIMYRSTDTNGNPVAITGAYIEPSKKWASGARPLVTYAAGTQGQGDACAPSLGLENPFGFKPGSVNVSYETPSIYGLLNRGFAVVVTDYNGLGTTNELHTYVNRLDQGRAVLDAARAALKVPGASVTSTSAVGAFGYSQGGGAAGSAAELAPSYAPDVNLKAAFVGAPPADLIATMKQADGTALTGVIGFAVNGFVQTYPELQEVLDAKTNDAGKRALTNIGGNCIGDIIGAYGFKKTSQWTNDGRPISAIIDELPAVKARVDEQKLGRLKPTIPVRIITGTRDDIVPHAQAKQLAKDWCAKGGNVDYRPVVQNVSSFGLVLNHLGPMLTESDRSQQWLAERLTGVKQNGNCSSLPRLQ